MPPRKVRNQPIPEEKKMAKKDEEIGYAEALAELEKILAELERADVDVDVLAARVQRASELIRLCRDRIGTARSRIEDVVGGLDG
ncbi:MAG: exodeoxyribonuclease VII small subunit [Ilumatobacteraceae bacterium]|jgi:exodeoxyribonuclease VII small subunit